MADQQQGGAVLAARFANQRQRLARILMVEIAGRFVGQHELGFVGQGAGDGHALLLAGGELPRIMLEAVAQPDAFEQFYGERAVHPGAEGHAQQHVFEAGVALEQVEGLEDVADGRGAQAVARRLLQRRHLPAGNGDAPGVGSKDAGDQMEERGLARAALALEGNLGLVGEAEVPHINDTMIRAIGSE